MKIELNAYCEEDLEMQCFTILKLLESGKRLKEIKNYINTPS